MFQNDAIVLGILFLVLGLIFWTSQSKHPWLQKFYTYVPALLLCYFIPGLLNTFGVVNSDTSQLYFVSSRYLLPACLILLTLSVDLPGIIKLGPRALIMFFTGTIGVIIGGPIALYLTKLFFPEMITEIGLDGLWRGMTTIAGSWIGGGANQASMKEIFEVNDNIFSMMVVIDVFMANIWMAVLLFLAPRAKKIDERAKADTSAINELQLKISELQEKKSKMPSTTDLMLICSVAFVGTGLSHMIADFLAPYIQANAPELAKFSLTSSFFWLIVVATTIGVAFSYTPIKNLEGAGASKVGNIFLYVLIASIGMHMDVFEIFKWPALFIIGFIWISIHAALVLIVGRLIRAPFFFIAIGSQANIGGAASAPVVASVFHPSLASVGVLLAVLGYVVGTYGAWLCGIILSKV